MFLLEGVGIELLPLLFPAPPISLALQDIEHNNKREAIGHPRRRHQSTVLLECSVITNPCFSFLFRADEVIMWYFVSSYDYLHF